MDATVADRLTNKNFTTELLADNVKIYLEIKNAFEQCHPDIQAAVMDMMSIYHDEESTEGERNRALFTIVEGLFPSLAVDFLSSCDKVRKSADSQQSAAEMAEEEKAFSDRVQSLMRERSITQTDLAELIGVGQSAISNMLNRQCRPQRRTVARIAEALGVSPTDLWPSLGEQA